MDNFKNNQTLLSRVIKETQLEEKKLFITSEAEFLSLASVKKTGLEYFREDHFSAEELFYQELFEEYLEDISLVIEQLRDLEPGSAGIDKRLLNLQTGLDGIARGAEVSIEIIKSFCLDSDLDLVRAAAFTLCSLPLLDTHPQEIALAFFSRAEEEELSAFTEAFKFARQLSLNELLLPFLKHEREIIKEATKEILTFRSREDFASLIPFLSLEREQNTGEES